MSKRKFKGALFVSSLLVFSSLAITGLTSCEPIPIQNEEDPSDQEDEIVINEVTITNKEYLTSEFRVGDKDRTLEGTIKTSQGHKGFQQLIDLGLATITSSDPSVVSVDGIKVKAVKEGSATITVKAGDKSDSVGISVLKAEEPKPEPESPYDTIRDVVDGVVKDQAEIRAKIVALASGGYFISDGEDILYVFNTLKDFSVGDVVIVTGDISDYNGLFQIGKEGSYSVRADDTELGDISLSFEYEEVTAEMLNTINDGETELSKKAKKEIVPVKLTATVYKYYEGYKYLWTVEGLNDDVILYSGYISEADKDEHNFQVGDVYEMEGFIGGLSNDETEDGEKYATRISFYPASYKKISGETPEPEPVEKPITISEVYNKQSGEEVFFYGKYTDKIYQNEKKYDYAMIVEDGDKAMMVYSPAIPEGLQIGDNVTVKGTFSISDYGTQISDGAEIKKADNLEVLPAEPQKIDDISAADLETDLFRLVDVKGEVLKNEVVSNAQNLTIKLEDGSQTVVRADGKYIDNNEDYQKLLNAKAGDKVTLQARFNTYGQGEDKTVQLTWPRNVTVTSSTEPAPTPTGLTISAGKTELTIGETTTLSYEISPAGTTGDVEFSTEDTNVVSLDGNKVTALSEGEAKITGKISGTEIISNEITIMVKKDEQPSEPVVTNATYQHTFVKGDVSQKGGQTKNINGIVWDYTDATYYAFDNGGIHLGSKNNPQTDFWTLSTEIPDGVYLTDFELLLRTNKDTIGTYQVSIGATTVSNEFTTGTDYESYVGEVNDTGKTLTIGLKGNNGIYIQSLVLNFYVPENVEFNVTTDDGYGTTDPDEPDNPPSGDDVYSGEIPETNFKPLSAEEYYKNINFNQEISSLKSDLQERLNDGFKGLVYSDASYYLQYTDEAFNGNGYLYGIYDGSYIVPKWESGRTWNKEHLWPVSRLPHTEREGISEGSDLFNLRACNSSINSSRGNNYYSEEGDSGYFPNEDKGDHRGDVARSIFYMGLKYESLGLRVVENPRYDKDNIFEMGKLSTLLKRNEEDPVDEFERQRNNRIYEYQGNRNPFVDYPELADKIY